MSTAMLFSARAALNRSSVRSRVASFGTRSSSWKVIPAAPRPASRSTASTGSSSSRTAPPKTSTPRQPTVQSPKLNLSCGTGVHRSFMRGSPSMHCCWRRSSRRRRECVGPAGRRRTTDCGSRLLAMSLDQVDDLMGEAVLVADQVTRGPPVRRRTDARLGHEDAAEAGDLGIVAVVEEVEDVHVLEVEGDRALGPVDLDADRVLASGREARGLERGESASAHAGDEDAASSTVTSPISVPAVPDRPVVLSGSGRSLMNVSVSGAQPGDRLPGDVLHEVDDVRADVAEGARAGDLPAQAPEERCVRVDDPVLQVLRPDVPDGADPPLGDEPLGQADGRHATVGEAHHRADARLRGLLGRGRHGLGLGDAVGERLLAEDVLAGLERLDGDLGVGVARGADVDQVDVGALDHRVPVGLDRLPAEPGGDVSGAPSRCGRRWPRSSGVIGRSKKLGALRHACECAAPMKA